MSDFLKAEFMGVEPPGHCKQHINQNCPDCSLKARVQSDYEAFDHKMLEQGVHYNKRGQYWDIRYRFLQPPQESFMYNRRQDMIMYKKIERRLKR